jgi:hypothetical protein
VPDLCERLRVDAQAFLREPDETLAPGARSRLRAPAKQPPVGARSRALCFTRSGAREREDPEAGLALVACAADVRRSDARTGIAS